MQRRKVVLVIGVPRSGSTWLTDILSSAADTDLVMEPDNEKTSILASYLKNDAPRFPRLSPGTAGSPGLDMLWDCAFASNWAPQFSRGWLANAVCRLRSTSQEEFIAAKPVDAFTASGGDAQHRFFAMLRRSGPGARRPQRIVKSVHAVLYPEWIVERCQPDSTLVIMRHPLAVLQSWRRMRLPDAFRLVGGAVGDEPREAAWRRMAEQLCIMYGSLKAATERNPDWHVFWHESLCADPPGQMREVARCCGIRWDTHMEQRLAAMNRTGEGYTPQREAAAEIDKWQAEVTKTEVDMVRNLFTERGLAAAFEDDRVSALTAR